eukprot:14605564-Alexandrium_andersonii.AAC.1
MPTHSLTRPATTRIPERLLALRLPEGALAPGPARPASSADSTVAPTTTQNAPLGTFRGPRLRPIPGTR